MNRREFMRNMGTTGLAASVPGLMLHSPETFAQPDPNGLLFLSFFCYGGTDASFWGDPRETTNINSWAKDKKSVAIGKHRYAPVASNKSNFDRFHDRMLITNGVSLPTNNHFPAMAMMLSGKLEGNNYPITSALAAATLGAGKALPWITIANRRNYMLSSGNVATTALKPSGGDIRQMIETGTARDKNDANVIKNFRRQLAGLYGEKGKRMPRVEDQLDAYLQASRQDPSIERLLDSLPKEYDQGPALHRFDRAFGDITMLMHAFAAGTTAVGSFWLEGAWDAHSGHDASFLTTGSGITGPAQYYFNRIVDHTWNKAKDLGIEDRLIVELNTDVGSMPINPGKSHWVVTNHMLMGKDKPWAGRTVGVSGPYHERLAIDPKTLQPKREADGGVILVPAHVQQLSRQVLGIENHPLSQKFAFSEETPLALNDPSVSSPINHDGRFHTEEKYWFKKPWS